MGFDVGWFMRLIGSSGTVDDWWFSRFVILSFVVVTVTSPVIYANVNWGDVCFLCVGDFVVGETHFSDGFFV